MDKAAFSYAEALFLIAKEEKKEEEYLSSLYEVCTAFEENPEYSVFLSSYTVSAEKRVEAFREAFGGKLPENVESFICILCEKRRTGELKEITEEYEKMYFAENSISKAYVTSAYPLDMNQREKLKNRLEEICGHRVKAEFFTDKNLLGGIKIEIDGKVIDSTVRSRLNKLREVMDR